MNRLFRRSAVALAFVLPIVAYAQSVEVVVDAAVVEREISPLIHGDQMNPWGSEWRGPEDRASFFRHQLQPLRLRLMRYPGGEANDYDWRHPHAADRGWWGADDKWTLNILEFVQLARSLGAEPIIGINATQKEPSFEIEYTGNGSSAALEITNDALRVSVAGATDGTSSLHVDLASSATDTVGELADLIDGVAGYDARPVNRLTNGDMEGGRAADGAPSAWMLQQWGSTPVISEAAAARDGGNATRIAGSSRGDGLVQEWLNVLPSTRYQVRAWINVRAGEVVLRHPEREPWSNELNSDWESRGLTVGATSGWSPVEYELETKALTYSLSLRFFANVNAPTDFLLDDVRLEKISDAANELELVSGRSIARSRTTIDFEIGSPEAAADLVRLLNVERGFGVKYFEIGNELYAWGEQTQTPEGYAERFALVGAAMKAVDPAIQLGVPSFERYPSLGPPQEWNTRLFRLAGRDIDFLAVHPLMPDIVAFPPEIQLAFPEMIDKENSIAETQRLFSEESPDARAAIPLFATEWGMNCCARENALFHTLASGIFAADMLGVLAKEGAAGANHSLPYGTAHGAFGGDPAAGWWKRPIAMVQELFGNHFGTQYLRSTISGPTYDVGSNYWPLVAGTYRWVTAYASADATRSRVYVMLVNRHATASYPASIRIENFRPDARWRAWTVNGPSLTSSNESGSHDDVKITQTAGVLSGTTVVMTIPAHSVTFVEIAPPASRRRSARH